MRKFIILCTLTASLVLPGASQAQWSHRPFSGDAWTIQPKHRDFSGSPFDGLGDPGSYENPWVLQGPHSGERYEMHPQYRTLGPFDGFRTPGSTDNPWVIEKKPW